MKFNWALRNLMRNGERSLLSLLMISGAILGLVLFRAFTDNSLRVVEDVSTEMNYGHFQLANKNYWQNSNASRGDTFLKNVDQLSSEIRVLPEVKSASGRLSAFGLLSSGEKTENASLIGFDLNLETGIKKSLKLTEGSYFSKNQSHEILIGHLLAHRLGLKINDEVTIVLNSVKKVINAGDFKVVGFFAAGTEEIDKYYSYISLVDLQTLMQTDGVDVLVVKLKSSNTLPVVASRIDQILNRSFPGVESRNWMSLSDLFRKVKSFYEAQNLIIQSILIFIVVLGVLNTIGMSVLERIGEMGTLRSLGTRKVEIYQLLLLETLFLVLAGILFGSSGALILGSVVNASAITTEIPGASLPVPVEFCFSTSGFFLASTLIFCTTIVAAFIPITKGLSFSIVEALRRNT